MPLDPRASHLLDAAHEAASTIASDTSSRAALARAVLAELDAEEPTPERAELRARWEHAALDFERAAAVATLEASALARLRQKQPAREEAPK